MIYPKKPSQTFKKAYKPSIFPVALASACIFLQTAGLGPALHFNRTAIDAGEWWLIVTGNFVHQDANHLFVNMAGLLLAYLLFRPCYSEARWAAVTLLSALGVGGGLYLLNPELYRYAGLSGVLHGLLLAGAVAEIGSGKRSSGAFIFLLTAAKLISEQLFGSPAVIAKWPVIVDSHLYGAITGGLTGVALHLLKHGTSR